MTVYRTTRYKRMTRPGSSGPRPTDESWRSWGRRAGPRPGAAAGLRDDVDEEGGPLYLHDGQAHPVDGNGVADGAFSEDVGPNPQPSSRVAVLDRDGQLVAIKYTDNDWNRTMLVFSTVLTTYQNGSPPTAAAVLGTPLLGSQMSPAFTAGGFAVGILLGIAFVFLRQGSR